MRTLPNPTNLKNQFKNQLKGQLQNQLLAFEKYIQNTVYEFNSKKKKLKESTIKTQTIHTKNNKKVTCQIEPRLVRENNKTYLVAEASVFDQQKIPIKYKQITLVASNNESRVSRILINSDSTCKVQQTASLKNLWYGYAHFILEENQVCILNFEISP